MLPPPVELLFCRTDMLLSKAIIWTLEEPASHLAIDMPACQLVVHSDLAGLRDVPRAEFLTEHRVVMTFKIHMPLASQRTVERLVREYVLAQEHPGYDFGTFAYFTWRALLAKCGGDPLPARSRWGSSGEYLCTEAAYLLNQAIVEVTGKPLFTYDTDLGALSPWQLLGHLQRAAGGANEIWISPPGASRSEPFG